MSNRRKFKKYKEKKAKVPISEKFSRFKTKKHLIKPIMLVTILILLQIAFFIYLSTRYSRSREWMDVFWWAVTLVMIIYFVNLDKPIDYRVSWIIMVSLVPIFSIPLYIILEIIPGAKQLQRRLSSIRQSSNHLLNQDMQLIDKIDYDERFSKGLCRYLFTHANYPIYENTNYKYFGIGEDYFESLKEDLRNAKKFIFIEYFIVRQGKMLEEILEILDDKINEGVEVKFMYDGMNDYYLPDGFKDFLKSLGIEVRIFSTILPILSSYHNNRDHRKIVVIDNKVAYTGGLNLSDEYINHIKRFGHWKDNGIRLEGEAVRSFTVMFLNLWSLTSRELAHYDKYVENEHKAISDVYILPYDDAPNDKENIGENVYIDILNQAKDYVYIMTPYLILSENLRNALLFAAKRGVNVQIMMPGIPDKKIPFLIGRSYYDNLTQSGVKIYEYVPGFLHSKCIVSDDNKSVVGTVNFDFRSLHLNYENGVLVYGQSLANDVKTDFEQTRKACREMSNKKYREFSWIYRLFCRVLRLIAPLM
ncbi:cardiolipin synthase [Helcococcus kunzii]|uniref:Cardiolipin synthase n=1 Tax=Helcococcus kunzii ATCC 51366 TaxID=883114 RepID=H3NMR4_9FIRM|nr:cardiolipin synthase [Helcococcus kunzii]EHR34655.1 hypothetical protein HMPREF9709_00625 [Helcococcus kunzii ATCC 51366]QUY64568.1 cardiolipin synthase [Helcococcus kunzii]QZO76981.1 cardiolipin synthase [Helcococcus kunzii]